MIFSVDSPQFAAWSPKPGASLRLPIEDRENHAMVKPYRLLLLITVMILLAGGAAAQTQTLAPWSPCVAEFGKLRDDVQKCGLAAKAAGQRKVSREEMCQHITAYSAAELKWVKYVETNAATCGFPAEVVQQLTRVHDNTEQTKQRICAPVRSFGPPNLGDGLGTMRPPMLETEPVPCRSPIGPLRIADP